VDVRPQVPLHMGAITPRRVRGVAFYSNHQRAAAASRANASSRGTIGTGGLIAWTQSRGSRARLLGKQGAATSRSGGSEDSATGAVTPAIPGDGRHTSGHRSSCMGECSCPDIRWARCSSAPLGRIGRSGRGGPPPIAVPGELTLCMGHQSPEGHEWTGAEVMRDRPGMAGV